jgi:hypothetical protein
MGVANEQPKKTATNDKTTRPLSQTAKRWKVAFRSQLAYTFRCPIDGNRKISGLLQTVLDLVRLRPNRSQLSSQRIYRYKIRLSSHSFRTNDVDEKSIGRSIEKTQGLGHQKVGGDVCRCLLPRTHSPAYSTCRWSVDSIREGGAFDHVVADIWAAIQGNIAVPQ